MSETKEKPDFHLTQEAIKTAGILLGDEDVYPEIVDYGVLCWNEAIEAAAKKVKEISPIGLDDVSRDILSLKLKREKNYDA